MANQAKPLIDRLKEQREKINARIQLAEARSKNSERKKDVRRKILVGAYYLEKVHKENSFAELKNIMDKFLKRDSDRILFDLPEKHKD